MTEKHPDHNCPECVIEHISWELLRDIDIVNKLDIEDKSTMLCSKCKGETCQ